LNFPIGKENKNIDMTINKSIKLIINNLKKGATPSFGGVRGG
jgi:hypothetical protein